MTPIHLERKLMGSTSTPNQEAHDTASPIEPRDEAYRNWIFTLPNVICMVRLVGSLLLLVLAWYEYRQGFLGLFIVLTISDWIDGRLARWLHQRSDFGARLDSFADATLYACLLFGVLLLCHEALRNELIWIAMAVGSYVMTTVAGLIKYGRVPSYHTLAAKKSQGIVLLAGILLVLEISVWPTRVAALAVTLTNMEASLLTLVLPSWRADVSSFWKVMRERAVARRGQDAGSKKNSEL
jgi:CDP-diacylglycerol--glycerol-3-phosphate 3-phosphatidyltransferase